MPLRMSGVPLSLCRSKEPKPSGVDSINSSSLAVLWADFVHDDCVICQQPLAMPQVEDHEVKSDRSRTQIGKDPSCIAKGHNNEEIIKTGCDHLYHRVCRNRSVGERYYLRPANPGKTCPHVTS
jgi:hypothetical protein